MTKKPNETVECKVCKEKILKGAKKCIKCDSYQGFRRNFNISTVVLSLVIALISIITAAAPIIKNTFTSDQSIIRFSYLKSDSKEITVVSSNIGNKPGILKGAKLCIFNNGIKTVEPIPLNWKNTDKNIESVIEPGKLRFFSLNRETGGYIENLPRPDKPAKECYYKIEFDIINFDHEDGSEPPPVTFHCSKIMSN